MYTNMNKVVFKRKTDWAKVLESKNSVCEDKCMNVQNTQVCHNLASTNTGLRLINPVQQGTDVYNRVGRHLNLKSLKLKLLLFSNGTVNALTDVIRVAVVYDRQPSGATSLPNYNQIFNDIMESGTENSDVYSNVNVSNKQRFVVLRDMAWVVQPITTTKFSPQSFYDLGCKQGTPNGNLVQEYIDLEGLTTHYKSSSSPVVIGDVATGALYTVVQSIYPPVSAVSAYSAIITTRLTYTDRDVL